MAAGILALEAETLKTEGNYNNLVGLPLTLFSLEERHQRAVLEMGMNVPGEIARLTEIADPDIGLITNVAKVHLEGVGDIRGVARAKTELIEKISPEKRVLINGDDDLLGQAAAAYGRKMMTFGLGAGNDVRAEDIRTQGRAGLTFRLRYDGCTVAVRLRVPGRQNVLNALAASAIAVSMETAPDHIVEGLYGFEGMKGRLMSVNLPEGVTLVDDTYNSNPASLKAALDSIGGLVPEGGRVIVGLGEMLELGDETLSAHFEAGGMVAEMGAYGLLAMGDHAGEVVRGAREGGLSSERTLVVDSHGEMARKIRDMMMKGDLVLLKGSRGMALEKVSRLLTDPGRKCP
jgi:UDP-N-acetylmuramoyl-tripeptide--D-alanyl-D-alanine ligase